MPNNPLTPAELQAYINPLGVPQMPPGYFLASPVSVPGPFAYRLFDASYISLGIIDPNRLGTGATGAGNLYLADDGTWKTISVGGGGDMLRATYDVDNDGVVDSAETVRIIVRNSTGSTLTKGSVVYLSGATGNRPNAILSQANSETTSSKTIGIVISNITNNSDGYVAVSGTLHDLDTSAFADGVAVWLSPTVAGGMTTTVPSEPNHSVFIGYIARSHPSQGRLVIAIQNGYELNELHDVVAPSPTNNDLLRFNSSLGYWQNQTISTIFGGTPLVSVPTLAQVTTAGNTTTNAITVGGLVVDTNTLVVDSVNNRVGIGTTSPAYNFQILDTTSGTPQQLDIKNTTAAARAAISLTNDVGNSFFMQVAGSSYVATTVRNVAAIASQGSTINAFWIATNWETSSGGTVPIKFVTGGYNNTPTMTITAGNTGNVLVGTTTDAGYKLDVNGTFRSNALWTTSSGIVQWGPQPSAYGVLTWDTGYARIHATTGNRLDLGAGGGLHMSISTAGNVGIGTTSPTYKLDVQGTTSTSGISTDIGLNLNPVTNPSTGSVSLVASAGNVDLGIHYYWVSYTTAIGETGTYNIGNVTTVSGSQQVLLTIPVSSDYRVTGRKLHRTKANGNSYETYVITTIANNTATTYTDNIADSALTGVMSAGFYQINTTNKGISVQGGNVMSIDRYATHFGINAGGSINGGGNNTLIGYNAGRFISTGNQNVGVGTVLGSLTTGGDNVAMGPSAAGGITIGSANIMIGRNAAVNMNGSSNQNIIIGSYAWNAGTPSAKQSNTGLGYFVGSTNTGNNNLFLGSYAGYYVTGSNNILLDTLSRADEATSKSSALIYGVTNATASSQTLSLGGGGNVMIGTLTNAGYRLDVIGSGRFYGATEDASNSGTLTIATANTNLRLGGNTTYSWIQAHSSKPLYINELGNNVILNLSGGSVGIGTIPSAKLHVAGTVQIGTTADASFSLRLTRTSVGVPQDAHFYAPTNNSPAVFYIEGGYYTGEAVGIATAALNGYPYYEKYFGNGSSSSYKHLGFINVANGSFGNTNLIPSIALLSTGNVGIGTTSPAYRVDVQGTTLATSSVSVQGAFNINPLAAPPAIGGFTLAAGTNLGVGQYYYFVTYVTAIGETSAGTVLSVVTTTGNTTVNLTGIPVSSDPRVTARKIYRTALNVSIDGQKFLATISDNVTTTYTDSIADASLTGVALQYYKINTTARYFTVGGVQGMVIDNNLTALGRNAGNAIITSSSAALRTVLIGANAGQNITTGQGNVIVGVAGANLTTGGNNALFGDIAGYGLTTGYDNTILGGDGAGRYITAGIQNVIIGAQAARNLANGTTQVTGGSNNTVIGVRARMSTISDTNAIIIGHTALGLGSNTTVIGNSSTTFTSIPAGNMTIGGTTNAGFKLDVQGTLRSTGQATLAGIAAQRSDTIENVITISQNGAAAAAHLYSLGDGYLGWVGHTAAVSRRFAFESSLANSGRNFGLYIYDSTGSNPTQVFYATKTHFYLGNTVNTNGSITAASAVARAVYISNALVAAANNDALVGLDIAPTFTNGAFTGISRIPFRAYLDTNSWVRYHNNVGSNYHSFEIRNDNIAGSGFASIQSQVQTRINYMQVYTPADSNTLFGVTRGGWAGNISENVSGMFFGTITAADVIVGANNTATMRIFNSTRNVLIQNGGTFTDAGYRLDVNGTVRVQNNLTVSSLTTDGPVVSNSGVLTSVAGYTGMVTIQQTPPLPPITFDIQNGIIVSVL
jgi:hypothetical protein